MQIMSEYSDACPASPPTVCLDMGLCSILFSSVLSLYFVFKAPIDSSWEFWLCWSYCDLFKYWTSFSYFSWSLRLRKCLFNFFPSGLCSWFVIFMQLLQPETCNCNSHLARFLLSRMNAQPELPRPELFDFHGVSMRHFFTDNWDNIQNFQGKPDDVYIVSYPKAGQSTFKDEILFKWLIVV